MTTVRIADIVPFAISDFVAVDTSINIDTTGTPSDYQVLLDLEIRSEMLLRVDGNVFSELAAGIYFVAIRNGDVAVYFVGPLGSNTEDRACERVQIIFIGRKRFRCDVNPGCPPDTCTTQASLNDPCWICRDESG